MIHVKPVQTNHIVCERHMAATCSKSKTAAHIYQHSTHSSLASSRPIETVDCTLSHGHVLHPSSQWENKCNLWSLHSGLPCLSPFSLHCCHSSEGGPTMNWTLSSDIMIRENIPVGHTSLQWSQEAHCELAWSTTREGLNVQVSCRSHCLQHSPD